jgi:ATP-dependent Clp protease ATP-binding subunit ClpA
MQKIQKNRPVLKEEITAEDIAEVVARWTGIPLTKMLEEERAKLERMEDELSKRVVGQKEAITKVADVIRRSRAGIADPNKPIGSFIFLGPTGVGKTELTKALAEFLFNDEKALIRVDMSEYMERHSVSKLVGSPPGYVGHDESGQLTESVRHRPYSVVLFDEIEKAHPEVFNVLLQVLDNGKLTDSKGRVVNFRNTVIIMTSNIGAQHIEKMEKLGFAKETDNRDRDNYEEAKNKINLALKDFFRPEFLNRLDDIIVFDVLPREIIREIVGVQIDRVTKRMQAKDIKLDIKPAVIEFLAEKGFDPQFGARPLNRLIQNTLLNKMANLIISDELSAGNTIIVDMKKDEMVFEVKKKGMVIAKKTTQKVKIQAF